MENSASSEASRRPIHYLHFEGGAWGGRTANNDRKRMERARQDAQEWINDNPGVEVVSIDSAFGNVLVIVTVWYRLP